MAMLAAKLQARGYSYNVWLTLLFKVSNSLALGIWSVAVLSTYIQLLEGDSPDATQKVGVAQAIQGSCLAAAALPLGWLSDHMGRSAILKGAGILKCLAIACTCTAVLLPPATHSYTMLCMALGLWGVAQADGPVIEALFADSVATGSRSTIYTRAYGSQLAAASIGPLLAALVFWLHGNAWELQVVAHIMLVGQVMQCVPVIIQFCFSDAKTLGHESEGVLRPLLEPQTAAADCEAQATETQAYQAPCLTHASDKQDGHTETCISKASTQGCNCSTADSTVQQQALAGAPTNEPNSSIVTTSSQTDSDQDLVGATQPPDGGKQHGCCCPLTTAAIPVIMALADFIMGMASGMTVKFFPLFFKDQVGLDPMSVSLLYCAIPLALAAFSVLAQRLSQMLGRVQVIVGFKMIGISLLVVMAYATNLWRVPAVMVPIHLVRTAVMNCCYPLQKSILMDYVPKARRARWNSLDSVTQFGWSGSAALGGWLIHKHGYDTALSITATVQALAWSLLLLLLPLVPRQEAHVHKAGPHADAAASTAAAIVGAEAAVEQDQAGEAPAGDVCEPLLQVIAGAQEDEGGGDHS